MFTGFYDINNEPLYIGTTVRMLSRELHGEFTGIISEDASGKPVMVSNHTGVEWMVEAWHNDMVVVNKHYSADLHLFYGYGEEFEHFESEASSDMDFRNKICAKFGCRSVIVNNLSVQ